MDKKILMAMTIVQLAEKAEEFAVSLQSIQETIDREGRPATAEEQAAIANAVRSIEAIDEERTRRETEQKKSDELLEKAAFARAKAAEFGKPQRTTQPETPRAARVTGGERADRGTHGFKSEGEFVLAARQYALGVSEDPRIKNAATTYGSEGVNADGGFAVPPDYRTHIRKALDGSDSLAALCDDQRTDSNRIAFPVDEDKPFDSTSGITVGYLGEGATIGQTKPKLQLLEVKLGKVGAIVPLTEELVSDAAQMTGYVQTKVPEKLVGFVNQELINGSGAPGKLMGIMNAGAKHTVAAKAGQGANTVVADNITKMWSSLPVKSRSRAVWLVHPDVEAVLGLIAIGNQPVYLPPGGLLNQPNGTLMGRPVISCEDCQTLGTEGDIILWDPKEYLLASKAGPTGVRADVSMHVYFEQDMTAMRFIMRMGGHPWWSQSIARKNGSSRQSPILTLNSTRT